MLVVPAVVAGLVLAILIGIVAEDAAPWAGLALLATGLLIHAYLLLRPMSDEHWDAFDEYLADDRVFYLSHAGFFLALTGLMVALVGVIPW